MNNEMEVFSVVIIQLHKFTFLGRENEESKEAEKEVMKPGMTFTIEPIITQGMDLVMVLSDNWTAVTVDGARTAQFENTVLITENGVEILTACNLIKLL